MQPNQPPPFRFSGYGQPNLTFTSNVGRRTATSSSSGSWMDRVVSNARREAREREISNRRIAEAATKRAAEESIIEGIRRPRTNPRARSAVENFQRRLMTTKKGGKRYNRNEIYNNIAGYVFGEAPPGNPGPYEVSVEEVLNHDRGLFLMSSNFGTSELAKAITNSQAEHYDEARDTIAYWTNYRNTVGPLSPEQREEFMSAHHDVFGRHIQPILGRGILTTDLIPGANLDETVTKTYLGARTREFENSFAHDDLPLSTRRTTIETPQSVFVQGRNRQGPRQEENVIKTLRNRELGRTRVTNRRRTVRKNHLPDPWHDIR